MALISNAKGRGEDETASGYERLFGNRQLGMLISKVQSAVISSGTELEGFLASRLKKTDGISIHKINKDKRVFKGIKKDGKRKTEHRGRVQRYKCKSCSLRFVQDNGFKRMRNGKKKITLCLDLFFRGLSTREIQEHLKAFYPKNSSHKTIYKWIVKYSRLISNYTDTLKINTGSYIEIDECEFHRRKSHKRKAGIDKNWLINGIDVKTRFLINSVYAKNRSRNEIKKFLLNIKNKSDNIKTITTDGFVSYTYIVKKSFGYNNKLGKYNINHKVVNASAGEGFNIWVERIHNSIRQRTRSFRGLHGSINSAYALFKGIQIFYNFVNKHGALNGKTPSDLAVPSLEFKTPNRWLELIEMAN